MSAPIDHFSVSFSQLSIDRETPRHNSLGDLRSLKLSILAQGVREPLWVRRKEDGHGETFVVVAGHGYRRFIAMEQLIEEGYRNLFSRVPIRMVRTGGPAEDAMALLASDLTEPLPLEAKARAVHVLLETKTLTEAASHTGLTAEQLKRLAASLAPETRDLVILERSNLKKPEPTTDKERLEELAAGLARAPAGVQRRASLILDELFRYLRGETKIPETLNNLSLVE
jgi:ParB-like chromosome segregation protein Spo0J